MSKSGTVSDGYHTFDELYEHRHLLFLNLMGCNPVFAWVSRKNSDGNRMEGWFIAGIELPTGQISYHLPEDLWDVACRCSGGVYERAPWDGHTAEDVLKRLKALLSIGPWRCLDEGAI